MTTEREDPKRKEGSTSGPDLDYLFGTWTESEAKDFLESVRSCEQIDEDF